MSTCGEDSREDKKGKGILHDTVHGSLPESFPKGLRVMLVQNDDLPKLQHVEAMLKELSYEVTRCGNTATALPMIRAHAKSFDIILTTANMDGFELLESIFKDTEIPIIMMSDNDEDQTVIKCITMGASDCLVSPIEAKDLKFLYKHVVPAMRKQMRSDEMGCSSGSIQKKAKLVWDTELNDKFKSAVETLGAKAVPSKILELMDVKELTRQNVASHLQKYRLSLSTPPIQPDPSLRPRGDDGGVPRPRNFMHGQPGIALHNTHQDGQGSSDDNVLRPMPLQSHRPHIMLFGQAVFPEVPKTDEVNAPRAEDNENNSG